MQVTLKVEGMMCPKCEARVKKALEALDGVETAVADRTAGTAVITGAAPAVEEAGYTVTE